MNPIMSTIERLPICGGGAFLVTFVLFPRVGARKALVLGWCAGAALLFATRGRA